MAYTVYGRFLPGYNDFGSFRPTQKGLEFFDEEIAKRLPKELSWAGDELLVELEEGETPGDARDRIDEIFDFDSVLSEAYDALCNAPNQDELWEE